MVGVDRLDYSKGLPERLDGIARFFERNPDRVTDVVFIQIAPPSREDIASYQRIRETLEQKTGEINGAYSQIDKVPIRYVNQGYSAQALFGIYRACKIGLVTPLRDGMNLVAKEFVASRVEEDGVLVLSEFAGAARELKQALLVNPHDVDGLGEEIQRALGLPPAEARRRMRALRDKVRSHDVHFWARGFLEVLAA
jgi:trehalose 6-phosphate synthase